RQRLSIEEIAMNPPGQRSRAKDSKKAPEVEWFGGITLMPDYVFDAGESFRPEILLWVSNTGEIVGTLVGKPNEVIVGASESLQQAIEMPMFGELHRPTRVQVSSPELAEVLRAGHPDIEIVCAPTPGLDDMFQLLFENMNKFNDIEPSYLTSGVTPQAMESLFKTAAMLYRVKPWKIVPDDQTLFSVTIEQLDVRDWVLSVIGQAGQHMGLVLFSSIEDFESFLETGQHAELGPPSKTAPHIFFGYERRAKLDPAMQKEISDHQWEVASSQAYPMLGAVDEDYVSRPLTSREVTITDTIAQALTLMLADKKTLRKAWKDEEPLVRTSTVTTPAGEIEITMSTPIVFVPVKFDSPQGILQKLASLTVVGDELDYESRADLEEELVRLFADSPEAEPIEDISACQIVMDMAADYLGHTIATLQADDLHTVLFDIIPRKFSIEASYAPWLIEVTRAFYAFLKREYGLKQADACLKVLEGDASERLEAALSDSSNFGIAKSFLMAGAEAGFDMQSEEGINAWFAAVQNGTANFSPSVPALGRQSSASKASDKAKKNKRKAIRKARRKNR
ncbi:MAG TPA: hypothetical protein PKK83_03835, partial [Polyangiaceae bacterium]|nr:hypothetical protein [Polyangiaceae bacterium]